MPQSKALPQKTFGKYRAPRVEHPNLIQNQVDSFEQFLKHGLLESLRDFSPIEDYAKKKFTLELTSFELLPPEFDEYFAKENKLTYEGVLKTRIKLTNKILGSVQEQEIPFAEFQ